MRGELGLRRLAIEGVAAAREDLPEPLDYGETLGQITKLANVTFHRAVSIRRGDEQDRSVLQGCAKRADGAGKSAQCPITVEPARKSGR